MRILDKYILQSFIGPFLFGVFAFTSIFVGTGTLFRIAQYITDYGASLWSVTKIFVFALPPIIVLTFPMSTLMAALMTFGRLSGNSEIIVMRSGGQAFLRLAMPIYVLAFFISIGTTAFNEYVVPAANHAYQTVLREEIRKEATPRTQSNILIKQMADGKLKAIMYAAQYDSQKKELYNVIVQEVNDQGEPVRIENSNKAIWRNGNWIMLDGVIHELSVKDGVQRSMNFKEQEMPVVLGPGEIGNRQVDPEEMTIRELRTQIQAFKISGQPTAELEMTMYSRFSIPLASFVFALIGACLGLQPQRSSSSMGFGISAIILFFYYGIMTLMQAFGKSGVLSPLLGSFGPNLLALLVGIYLNWRASK